MGLTYRTTSSAIFLSFFLPVFSLAADRYWVRAADGNWNDATLSWATSSGGLPGASVPVTGDNVFFDAGSVKNCTIDIPAYVSSMTIASVYTGTITFSNANQQLTVSNDLTFTSGTFSTKGSSVTVEHDLKCRGGVFITDFSTLSVTNDVVFATNSVRANGGSVWNFGGNYLHSPSSILVRGQSLVNMSGTSKGLSTATVYTNMTISGSITNQISQPVVASNLLVTGSFALANSMTMNDGSTVTVSGIMTSNSAAARLYVQESATIAPGGTFNVNVYFRSQTQDVWIPARTYGGQITAYTTNTGVRKVIFGAGTHTITNNFAIRQDSTGSLLVDMVTASPTITIINGSLTTAGGAGTGYKAFNLGTGVFDFEGVGFTIVTGSITQAIGGTLRFSGSVQNIVTLSTPTFYNVDLANTNGTIFNNSINVSSLTMTVANSSASFAAEPSSFSVTGHLALNGKNPSTHVHLRSGTKGSVWDLLLSAGATQSVRFTDVQDCTVGLAQSVYANDGTSIDLGNNTNWVFSYPSTIFHGSEL